MAVSYVLTGAILCLTIIGIPSGIQAFKMAGLALQPFGKKVIRDSLTIDRRGKRAFSLIEQYNIDVLLVKREWMTPQLNQGKWICVFENFNASLYLRNTPAAADSLQRCADYYAAYIIPFDPTTGFNERLAYAGTRRSGFSAKSSSSRWPSSAGRASVWVRQPDKPTAVRPAPSARTRRRGGVQHGNDVRSCMLASGGGRRA